MNYKRIVLINVVAYFFTILAGIILSALLDIKLNLTGVPSPSLILTSMLLAVIFTTIGAFYYFKMPDAKKGAREGFIFGVISTITAFALDMFLGLVITLLGFDAIQFLSTVYKYWFLGFAIILGLVFTTLIGKFLKK